MINKNDVAWMLVTAWVFGVAIGVLLCTLVSLLQGKVGP